MRSFTFAIVRNPLALLQLLTLCLVVLPSAVPGRGNGVGIILSPALAGRTSDGPDVSSPDDNQLAETEDGGTADQSPGLGIEYETDGIEVVPQVSCQLKDFAAARQKQMNNRGDFKSNWVLTADIGLDYAYLGPEYIVNGKLVKLDSDQAKAAAAAIAADVVDWDPVVGQPISIPGSECAWKIGKAKKPGGTDPLTWHPQVTAPMPLDAIQDLIVDYSKGHVDSPLLSPVHNSKVVPVTVEWFDKTPGLKRLKPRNLTKRGLGFLSLLLAFAKQTKLRKAGMSLKHASPILPRTDWTTIYNAHIAQEFAGLDLHELLVQLSCLGLDAITGKLSFDPDYCDDDFDLKAGPVMDKQIFGESNPILEKPLKEVTVPQWIKSITDGPAPDALTELDRTTTGSIGGLGSRQEFMVGTNRPVPLFEFRTLDIIKTSDLATFADSAKKEILRYHAEYRGGPALCRRFMYSGAHLLDARQVACNLPIANSSSPSSPSSSGASQSTPATPSLATTSSVTKGPALINSAPNSQVPPSSLHSGTVSCIYNGEGGFGTDEMSSAHCICGDSYTMPIQPTTSGTAATAYHECNPVTPVSALTTPTSSSSSTGYWAGTTTLGNKMVLACETFKRLDVYEGVSTCAGTSLTLYAPPSASVTMATSTSVHVGQLTGAPLYTSVSNALISLCPTPTGNAVTSCDGKDNFVIKDVPYWNYSDGEDALDGPLSYDGEVVVSVPISRYNSTDLRNGLIKSIALVINSSATASSCYTEQTVCSGTKFNDCVSGTVFRFCNAPELVEANYYSAKYETNEDPETFQIVAQMAFTTEHHGGEFTCEEIEAAVDDALALLGPEMILFEDVGINDVVSAVCNAIEASKD